MIKIIASILLYCLFNALPSYAEEASQGQRKEIEISPKKIKQGAKRAVEKTEKGLKKAAEKTGEALEKAGKKIKKHVSIEKDE
ncbi:MAG: hypothetical protein HY026_07815 [Deltaproteobacteria bacterium]|nr:hypothetical protein [Deltaproteobacteria bacterium]